MKFIPLVVLACGLVACSTMNPIPRDQLAANMAPILKIEKRYAQVSRYTKILGSQGWISEQQWEELKPHYDVYYVYYLGANFHLAKGNLNSYLEHIQMAERELDVIEAVLKDTLAKEREMDSGRKREFSGFNL
jgi:hypothetical protein